MSSFATNYQMNIHQVALTVAWSLVLNAAIVAGALRYNRAAALLHAVFGWLILVLTFIFILCLLIPLGFNVMDMTWGWRAHGTYGTMLLGFSTLQVVGGTVIRWLQHSKKADFPQLTIVKSIHRYMGYFLAITYKVMTLWSWTYNYDTLKCLFAWEVLCIVTFLVFKLASPKMTKTVIDSQINTYLCPEIGSIEEINKVTDNYFIFSNYVYDAKGLTEEHPGGHKVIELMKGREVDRFIYGMYAPELYPDLPVWSHSALSMQLAGSPVAKLVVPPTFAGFTFEVVEGHIKFMNCVSKITQIYSIGLVQKYGQPLRYLGYRDVRQLGQYYSFTFNGYVTRLYTSVNFLAPTNIVIMEELLKTGRDSRMRKIKAKKDAVETELPDLEVAANPSSERRESLLKKMENPEI
jgi:hypothetical protein